MGQGRSLRVGAQSALPEVRRPTLERSLPFVGYGSTWLHGYSGKVFDEWRRWAEQCKGHAQEPSPELLSLSQVVWVCRTGPEPDASPTFVLTPTEATPGMTALHEALPYQWVKAVCLESDGLAMTDYIPPEPGSKRRTAEDVADIRLGTLLADRKFWASMSALCVKLYGVPLAARGEPIGEVLSHIEHDRHLRTQLLKAFGGLAAASGGL